MFVHSPDTQHRLATKPSDSLPKAMINKQLHNNWTQHVNSYQTLRKPTAFPEPPRPPTPGPRPYPPMPPRPPVPTPPPSPQYSLICSLTAQSPILVSGAEPIRHPHPQPPPSPVPRRPGPVNPPPNVPTPPPSPGRSASPWTFSPASNIAALVGEYLSLATWDQDTAHECVTTAISNSTDPKSYSDSPITMAAIIIVELLENTVQKLNKETPRNWVAPCEQASYERGQGQREIAA